MRRTALFALPWMALSPAVFGQTTTIDAAQETPEIEVADDSGDRWTLSGYWDNDGGPLKRNNIEDRHYTNGFGFTLAHQAEWAEWLNERLPFGDEFDRTAGGYMIGQQMFTPENIETTAIIDDDRPYAGYLWAGVYFQRANETTLDHLQIDLGVMGDWSQADTLQDEIHEWTDGIQPQGWANQIGEQVTFQATYRRKWRFDLNPIDIGETRIESQFIPQAGLTLGTVHRFVEGAGLLRVGYNLPDDFGPGRLTDVASATGEPRDGFYLYGYGRVAGRVVEHNATLEGNPWSDDPHTVDEEPLVGELTAGLATGYRWDRWAAEVSYSQTYISEEFEDQDASDGFGSLAISLTGWF